MLPRVKICSLNRGQKHKPEHSLPSREASAHPCSSAETCINSWAFLGSRGWPRSRRAELECGAARSWQAAGISLCHWLSCPRLLRGCSSDPSNTMDITPAHIFGSVRGQLADNMQNGTCHRNSREKHMLIMMVTHGMTLVWNVANHEFVYLVFPEDKMSCFRELSDLTCFPSSIHFMPLG